MSFSSHFKTFGVELEYMIVDEARLDVSPTADKIIHEFSDSYDGDVERSPVMWSNELALHVLEIKTATPVSTLERVEELFQDEVRFINRHLSKSNLCLLPGGMHPWMDPSTTKLWPHGNREIYQAFDRIFDCRGHGWGNLQSVHLNLPFSDDASFLKLHTAIRAILPILPALSASSPFADARFRGIHDYRLEVYRKNCARIPSVTGKVVPEPVRNRSEYESLILQRIYDDLAPHDSEGILRYEWANARGAITRFDRNTIEIRVLDIQECPAADLAVLRLIVAVVEALIDERWTDIETLRSQPTEALAGIFVDTAKDAQSTVVNNAAYLRCLGVTETEEIQVGELWNRIAASVCTPEALRNPFLRNTLANGTLSERLVKTLGANPTRDVLLETYRRLAQCLEHGEVFNAS